MSAKDAINEVQQQQHREDEEREYGEHSVDMMNDVESQDQVTRRKEEEPNESHHHTPQRSVSECYEAIVHREIVEKYQKGKEKVQVDDWENPDFALYHYIDRYGFIHKDPLPDKLTKYEQKIRALEVSRSEKWGKMLKDKWPNYRGTDKLRQRVFKGIPDQVRGRAWALLLEVPRVKREQEGRFKEMLEWGLKNSKDIRQIDLDVNRTFRNNIMFKDRYDIKQQELFRILVAYSVYNSEIGYCQGMSQITALLLMYMHDEEEVFWALNQLMTDNRYAMHGFFIPGFPKLTRFAKHHDKVLKKYLPKVFKHFKKFDIDSTLYTLKWFFQCFLDRVPFSLTLRLWDCFMFEGEVILTCMSYTLLKLHKKTILHKDMEDLIEFLQVDLEKDFGYHDDEAIQALQQSITELRRHKMDRPKEEAPDYEKPMKPFGYLLTADNISTSTSIADVESIILRPDGTSISRASSRSSLSSIREEQYEGSEERPKSKASSSGRSEGDDSLKKKIDEFDQVITSLQAARDRGHSHDDHNNKSITPTPSILQQNNYDDDVLQPQQQRAIEVEEAASYTNESKVEHNKTPHHVTFTESPPTMVSPDDDDIDDDLDTEELTLAAEDNHRGNSPRPGDLEVPETVLRPVSDYTNGQSIFATSPIGTLSSPVSVLVSLRDNNTENKQRCIDGEARPSTSSDYREQEERRDSIDREESTPERSVSAPQRKTSIPKLRSSNTITTTKITSVRETYSSSPLHQVQQQFHSMSVTQTTNSPSHQQSFIPRSIVRSPTGGIGGSNNAVKTKVIHTHFRMPSTSPDKSSSGIRSPERYTHHQGHQSPSQSQVTSISVGVGRDSSASSSPDYHNQQQHVPRSIVKGTPEQDKVRIFVPYSSERQASITASPSGRNSSRSSSIPQRNVLPTVDT